MARYKVIWQITILDATDPLDAADQANALRRNDPGNEYSYFRTKGPGGDYHRVDTDNRRVLPISEQEAQL